MARYFTNRDYELRQVAAVQARRERAEEYARNFTADDADRLRASYRRNPQARASVHLAQRDLPPQMQDDLARRLIQAGLKWAENYRPGESRPPVGDYRQAGFGFDAIDSVANVWEGAKSKGMDALKQTAQVALPALDVGSEIAQGEFRNMLGGVSAAWGAMNEDDFRGLWDAQRQVMDNSAILPGAALSQAGQGLVRQARGLASGDPLGADSLAYGPGHVMSQTRIGQIANEVATTGALDRSDWGDGWFINMEAEIEDRRREAERHFGVLNDGQTITAGRQVAEWLHFDPNFKGVNLLSGTIDAGVAIWTPSLDNIADPKIAAGVGRLINAGGGARRTDFMRQVGAHRGAINQINLDEAGAFLSSTPGQRILRRFVDAKGPSGYADIWRMTKGQYDPQLVARLVDADNVNDAFDVVIDGLRRGVAPEVRTIPGTGFRHALDNTRMFGEVPSVRTTIITREGPKEIPALDLKNPRQAVGFAQDFAQNVKAPEAMRDMWIEAMGRATNAEGRRNVYHRILRDTETQILSETTSDDVFAMLAEEAGMSIDDFGSTPVGRDVLQRVRDRLAAAPKDRRGNQAHRGFSREQALQLGRYSNDDLATARISMDEMLSMSASDHATLTVGDRVDRLRGSMLLSESADYLPIPDLRDLRRATSSSRVLMMTMDDPQGYARIAKVLEGKIIAGQAIRGTRAVTNFALSGLSAFNGVWKVSRLLRPAYVVRVVGEEQVRMAAAGYNSMFRHPLSYMAELAKFKNADDLTGALLMDSRASRLARTGSDMSGVRTSFTRFGNGATILSRANALEDPRAMRPFVEAWQDEMFTLAGDEIASHVARGTTIDEVSEWLTSGSGKKYYDDLLDMHPELGQTGVLDEYLLSVHNRIEAATGGNMDLRRAIGRGSSDDLKNIDLNPLVGDFAPERVRGDISFVDKNGNRTDFGAMADKATAKAFEWIAEGPTNRFSRSPVFMQAYKENILELAPLAANGDALARAAVDAGLGDDVVEVIKRTAGTEGLGLMSVADIDDLAKTGALGEVQTLLYDMGRRSQFFDIFRLIFPFGDAWKEVLTTWADLAVKNPATLSRRLGQAAEGARDAGVFHEDQYGDLVFSYPGSEWLTEKLIGVPVKLDARAAGLSLMSDVTPGFGPVLQVPAYKIMPETTGWDSWRKFFFPYGDPGDPRNVLPFVTQSFFGHIINADGGITQRGRELYANTTLRIMAQMAASGEYDRTNPEDEQRLFEDANRAGRWLSVIRGAVQSTAPSAPRLNHQMVQNGALVDLAAMRARYRELQDEDYESALERFVDEVGLENIYAIGSNSVSVTHGGIPVSGDGYEWIREHPEVMENHRELGGYFAPYDPNGEFNSQAFQRAKSSGELKQIDPRDAIRRVNDQIANRIYRNASDDAYEFARANGRRSLVDAQREYLRELKQKLERDWPGYNTIEDKIGRRPPIETVINRDIPKVLADPLLMETEAGQGLQHYWAARQDLIELHEALGVETRWQDGDASRPLREWLRYTGNQIARDYPDFSRMWDQFLSREFEEED